MGLKVSRVLTVGESDEYAWFLYYVPSSSIEYDWINTWMATHFDRVAESIGSGALLIAPFPSRQERYVEDLAEAIDWFGLSEAGREIGWNPALVATRVPLRADTGSEATVIDLAQAASEQHLARLLDTVAGQIRDGGDLTRPSAGRFDRALSLLGFLELKPNVAGVGLNVNAVAEWYRRRRGEARRPRRGN
ncbi:hypothetical protein [Actinoplanes sp. NPDC049265]|uniref:hypothetical protein n=1 Tax=Actinoplanes sp. NPDC049265 TaxID=3363902 RepID=UPI0037173F68